jgi:hypothetical protein
MDWTNANSGTGDDHSSNTPHGYACCGGATPPNPRVPVKTATSPTGGQVSYLAVHNVADTEFSGAVAYCGMLDADLCSDSQTLILRDAGLLTVPTWTNSHSDNDGLNASIGVGSIPDNQPLSATYGYACCVK